MARVTRNSLLSGLSGKLGGIVIRQVGGQTIVSAAEGKKKGPGSVKQQAQRHRMHLARLYAADQLLDPAAKALYATGITEQKTSARTVAISDFMRGPVITATDLSNYHGQPGDPIRIWATDNFAVTAVQVRLYAATGVLTAQGPATPEPGGSWLFQAATDSADQPGARVEVEAQDRPGNLTSQSYIRESGRPGGWVAMVPPAAL